MLEVQIWTARELATQSLSQCHMTLKAKIKTPGKSIKCGEGEGIRGRRRSKAELTARFLAVESKASDTGE